MSGLWQRWWQRRLFRLACWFALWTVLGVIEGAEVHSTLQMEGRPAEWLPSLRRGLESCLLWSVVGLGVLWWAGRRPFERGHTGRWLLGHVLGCAVAVCLFNVAYAAVLHGQISLKDGSTFVFGAVLKKLFTWSLLSHVCIYLLIVLFHYAWHYYRQYDERERQASALATQLVQARLQALRMQLNPHFLFNTLNTISALIHEQPEAADRMIVRLSELLRRTLERPDTQEVPLREEIEFLRSYLAIEQVRFQDRLTVQFDIEPRALDLLVPDLILQPLVENALRHGIEPREEPGRLEITARVQDDRLEIRVRDNGSGLPGDFGAQPREGIGLANVRSRLTHLYGGAQRLEIADGPGGGVEARLSLPCCTVPGAQAPRVIVMSADSAALGQLPSLPADASTKTCCS